jgi:hypothetical protein
MSRNISQIYEPFFDETVKALVACSNFGEGAAALAQKIRRFISGSPGPLGGVLDWLSVDHRGLGMPEPEVPRSPVRLLADF